MTQSRTLYVGMDVQKDSSAVAYVAKEHHVEVVSLGHRGTRPCDIDQLLRRRHSQSPHLVLVDEAGPCGSWLDRSRTTKGQVGWGVAPSLIPKKSGDRSKTNRRDAITLAHLLRSGDLTPVYVPTVEDAAMCDLGRAREETLRARKAAKCRLKPFSCGRTCGRRAGPPGARPTCGGSAQWSVLPRRRRSSSKQTSGPFLHPPSVASVWSRHCTTRGTPGVSPPWSQLSRPGGACSAP
jgi:hypothetical protein